MATSHIANWAFTLQYTDLPDVVVRAAVQSFHNWLGCAIAGADHAATKIVTASTSAFFGPATSSLLGRTVRADAQHAALINGIAGHVHDYDDTHLDTIIHPTGPVASALLAVAEWKGGISGKQFLLALIVGIEIECKVGMTVWPEHYDVGWHITSTTGSIGAAVAVSKLLNLSVEQTIYALGIASTQVTGLREQFGSHTKSFHPGRAAQNGLLAAILASNGYTASPSSLEAKRGWVNVVGITKDTSKLEKDTEKWLGMGDSKKENVGLVVNSEAGDKQGLGRWEILRNSFKPYPCGIVVHPIIDGCSQIHHNHLSSTAPTRPTGDVFSRIKSVRATVHPLVLELTGKRTPKDGLEAKFSAYHGAAIGLLYGKGTPEQYEDKMALSEDVIKVRDVVLCVADAKMRPDQCQIQVELDMDKEGTVLLTQDVNHALGSLEVPMTERMLEEKFLGQTTRVLGVLGARRMSERTWGVAGWDDVSVALAG